MSDAFTQAASVAANWWASHLRSETAPSRDTDVTRADDHKALVEALIGVLFSEEGREIIAKMERGWAEVPNFPEDVIVKFKNHLYQIIYAVLAHRQKNGNEVPVYIGVDYEPGVYLELSAEAAGIENIKDFLPQKTSMWVTGEKVSVREGLNGNKVVLWDVSGEV